MTLSCPERRSTDLVGEVVYSEESDLKISELKPKGGGGTDFRPAIALAETMRPDLIVYLTDLAGTFPDRKPRTPIIWAFPPTYSRYETPFGLRLRSEEHTSELQSLMRISYAVFCLKKKKNSKYS